MIALVAATVAISWLFCYCTLKCSFAWYLLLLCSSSARREQMDVVWAGCVCGHLLACAELLLPLVLFALGLQPMRVVTFALVLQALNRMYESSSFTFGLHGENIQKTLQNN